MRIDETRNSLEKIEALDQDLLIAHEIGKSREFVLAHPEFSLSGSKVKKIKAQVTRRKKGEPLAYILKEKEFFSLPFFVDQATLIPRPETELLVEKVLEELEKSPHPKTILEIGTGSGCISIALAHVWQKNQKRKNWKILANDFSSSALQVAQKNSRENQTEKLIDFFVDDLLGKITLQKIQAQKFVPKIILVANLPYVSEKEYSHLMPSVKNFEPASALLSGKDGFDHYRRLLNQLEAFSQKPENKKVHWKIFWEIGHQQKSLAQKEIQKTFPQSQLVFSKDLAGHWRVVEFEI